jgi:hypothetical protein
MLIQCAHAGNALAKRMREAINRLIYAAGRQRNWFLRDLKSALARSAAAIC